MIRTILIWLFIFIVGSLIVNFIINPNEFESFKSNIKEKISEINIPDLKNSKEEASQQKDYTTKNFLEEKSKKEEEIHDLISNIEKDRCYFLDTSPRTYSKEKAMERSCRTICYDLRLYYHSNKCEGRDSICYCEDK